MTQPESIPGWEKEGKETDRSHASWIAEFRKSQFDAEIRDRDSRILSSGQAKLEADGCSGVFWPSRESPKEWNPENAEFLTRLDDRGFFAVRNFRKQHGSARTFDFEYLIWRPSRISKLFALALTTSGEPVPAKFDSLRIGDQILLILGKGLAPDKGTICLCHDEKLPTDDSARVIPKGALLPERWQDYSTVIDLRDYLWLPQSRRGFVEISWEEYRKMTGS